VEADLERIVSADEEARAVEAARGEREHVRRNVVPRRSRRSRRRQ
jgi:hypothetical protein